MVFLRGPGPAAFHFTGFSMHHIYVLNMLGYGAVNRAKVGIAKNVAARIRNIGHSYGGLLPVLFGFFTVQDEKTARQIERSVIKEYPKDKRMSRTREVFLADPKDIVALIKVISPGIEYTAARQ